MLPRTGRTDLRLLCVTGEVGGEADANLPALPPPRAFTTFAAVGADGGGGGGAETLGFDPHIERSQPPELDDEVSAANRAVSSMVLLCGFACTMN